MLVRLARTSTEDEDDGPPDDFLVMEVVVAASSLFLSFRTGEGDFKHSSSSSIIKSSFSELIVDDDTDALGC